MRLRLQNAYVDGVKIHDVDDLGNDYAIKSAIRTRIPRESRRPRARALGSVDRSEFYDGQVIELEGHCDAGSDLATEDALDELGWLFSLTADANPPLPAGSGGRDHVFTFRRLGRLEDETLLFREANAFEAPAKGWAGLASWSVTLFGPDPRIYSTVQTSGSYDPVPPPPNYGLVFPLDPVAGGVIFAVPLTQALLIENSGTAPTPPLLTVTGPVTNPIIDNDLTGEHFYTTGVELTLGEQMVVDVAKHTVRVQGELRQDVVDARQTTWFDIRRGPNYLRLRGSGMVSGQTALGCTFYAARI